MASKDGKVNAYKTSEDDESSSGGTAESESTDVFEKIRRLFGDDIYDSLQREEINSPQLIVDLADRDADAPIFGKLGFTYGKASRFKQEFETKKVTHHDRGRLRPLICSPAPSKPTMAEMSNFRPEMKQLYLSKRKKIGLLATSRWGNNCPKFNTPETKSELKEFSVEIASECAIPEINFNEEGMADHVKTFSSEQRRYRKNKSSSCKVAVTRKIEVNGQRKKQKGNDLESSVEERSGGSSETDNSSPQGGNTDSVDDEDEEENISHSSPLPLTQVMPVCVVGQDEAWDSNFKANQVIVKSVFSRVLKREEIIDVLKKKFSLQQKNLTGLKPSGLMAVLAKKLIRNDYCRLNVKHGEIKNKDDLTVVKEIAL